MTDFSFNTEDLILKILEGKASPEEFVIFSAWICIPENEVYFKQVKKLWNLTSGPHGTSQQLEEELQRYQIFMRQRNRRFVVTRSLRRLLHYAAILLFLCSVTIYLWLRHDPEPEQSIRMAIHPGKAQAVLILADREPISLHHEISRNIVLGEGVKVTNTSEGIIYFDTLQADSRGRYHRLCTPRGGEYNITLSDGTRVYLNAGSELKFPEVFEKEKREVFLSGEAFFDVARDENRPFYVKTDAMRIQVLGTSFNVNTHYIRGVQTVLIHGKINVKGSHSDREYVMQPSELAQFSANGTLEFIRDVDVSSYIAWRNGRFSFEEESLEQIMNTLALWYDIEVVYKNEEVKNYHFTGNLERYEQFNVILDAIAKMVDVTFSIQGKKIIVSK